MKTCEVFYAVGVKEHSTKFASKLGHRKLLWVKIIQSLMGKIPEDKNPPNGYIRQTLSLQNLRIFVGFVLTC
jgi:hypothetical protein